MKVGSSFLINRSCSHISRRGCWRRGEGHSNDVKAISDIGVWKMLTVAAAYVCDAATKHHRYLVILSSVPHFPWGTSKPLLGLRSAGRPVVLLSLPLVLHQFRFESSVAREKAVIGSLAW